MLKLCAFILAVANAERTFYVYPEADGFEVKASDLPVGDSEFTFPNATLVGGMFDKLAVVANVAANSGDLQAQWNHDKVKDYLTKSGLTLEKWVA